MIKRGSGDHETKPESKPEFTEQTQNTQLSLHGELIRLSILLGIGAMIAANRSSKKSYFL